MLIIKNERIKEVAEKYNMREEKNCFGKSYYKFGKTFAIYPDNEGLLEIRMGGTKLNLDLLYELIQMGAVEKTTPAIDGSSLVALQKRIAQLEKELEEERNKNMEGTNE